MANLKTNIDNYTAIANAIRAKNGSSDTYTPSQMASAINDLDLSSKWVIPNGMTFFSFVGTSLDVASNFDSSNVTNAYRMFGTGTANRNYTSLDLSSWDVSNLVDAHEMFIFYYPQQRTDNLSSINLDWADTSSLQDTHNMFNGCTALTSLDLSSWDVSNVTDMSKMFWNTGLTSLDITGWDTSNVTTMQGMFEYSRNLNLSNVIPILDVSGITSSAGLSGIFRANRVTTSFDLHHWDVSNISSLQGLFMECTAMTSFDISGWNTSNVTNINNMFNGCTGITSIVIPQIDLSGVTDMSSMFSGCTYVTSIDMSNVSNSVVTNTYQMFHNCKRLNTLDISGLDFTNDSSYSGMFGSSTTRRVPANCRILVKDQTQKDWFTTNFSWLTNVQIKQ